MPLAAALPPSSVNPEWLWEAQLNLFLFVLCKFRGGLLLSLDFLLFLFRVAVTILIRLLSDLIIVFEAGLLERLPGRERILEYLWLEALEGEAEGNLVNSLVSLRVNSAQRLPTVLKAAYIGAPGDVTANPDQSL